MPHVRYRCPGCGSTVKSNTKWEWIGDLILGVLLSLILFAAMAELLSWFTSGIAFVIVFGGGWFVFPYVTKFDLVEKPQTVQQFPAGDRLKAPPKE